MRTNDNYNGGENFDLREILLKVRKNKLNEKTSFFNSFINDLVKKKEMQHLRIIDSAADREVLVKDPITGELCTMLMFGSNNYLGFANHPYVIEKVKRTLEKFGAGIGGPPLLNGYTSLHRELEERIAYLKGAEDALLFSSGYAANVGLLTAFANKTNKVIYDQYSHASFADAMKLSGVHSIQFEHNNIDQLDNLLEENSSSESDLFVGVEGVYSMDGDTAPLDKVVSICKKRNAILILDDAHGTGTMGDNGHGTAEHYKVEGEIDISMGTFSKTFSATGGFVAASKPIVQYLRFFARSYMFSASLPPTVIATVLAGLDLLENEKHILEQFRSNVNYAVSALNKIGFDADTVSGIIPLRVPCGMNIRRMAYEFHKRGIFINSIEYPAVPVSEQRFRISIIASHTKEDIDKLINAIREVWESNNCTSSLARNGCAA